MASFVELKQHSRQIFEAHAAQSTDETAPQSITPEIVLFAGSLSAEGPLMLPVEADECGIYGWCSDGVEEKIRRAGGTIRFGWTIWEWPGLMLTAEFHAVWVDPAGQHHEITPKPQGETQIVFVPDSTYPRAFNFDERPINRRYRIYRPVDPMKQALERIAQMKPSQRSYETKRAQKAGLSLEARLCQKIPVDPLPAEIDEFIEICAGLESKMDRSEKFDHAHILGDAEFEELMRRKIALLQSINKKKLILAMR